MVDSHQLYLNLYVWQKDGVIPRFPAKNVIFFCGSLEKRFADLCSRQNAENKEKLYLFFGAET